MNKGRLRSIVLMLIALVIAYGGVALTRYADADDSPGGMVIGGLVVGAAVLLGAKALQRRDTA